MTEDNAVLLARIDTHVTQLLQGRDDHERRLRKIEQFMWLWIGAASIGGGAFANILQSNFTH